MIKDAECVHLFGLNILVIIAQVNFIVYISNSSVDQHHLGMLWGRGRRPGRRR